MSDDPKPRPDVEKLKQYVQEKLREGLKGFAGQPNSDEALKAAEVICREALEDFKNAWLIPTFKVTVKHAEKDKTILIGTIQGFMPSGREYEDIVEIGRVPFLAAVLYAYAMTYPGALRPIPESSNATPPAVGAGAVGTSTRYARQDHTHTASGGTSGSGAMVSPLEIIVTSSRYAGGSLVPTLGGGSGESKGIIFRPLREMTITGARFYSMATVGFPIITWNLRLWDMDSLAQQAAGSFTTAGAEALIRTVTFGTPRVIAAADVNRRFGVTFRDNAGVLTIDASLAPWTAPGAVGADLKNRFLSRDIFLCAVDAYANGNAAPTSNWGSNFSFTVEPVFTVP